MERLYTKEYCPPVNVIGAVMVPPSQQSPKTFLYLSNLDDHLLTRARFDALLVYNNASQKSRNDPQKSENPVKVIRDALAQVLTYYYPLAGRVKRTQDGQKLQVECTGEGALFVEVATDKTLSQLGDLEELKSSHEQLLFNFPPTTEIEEVPPVIFQVTRLKCGAVVVGASFNHTVCDGRGAAQFLKGVAEIARGEAKLSIEPVWQREVLKPQEPPLVRFQHDELLESGFLINANYPMQLPTVKVDELVLASSFMSSDAIEKIKQPIAEELKEHCTTFEVLSALAWRARTIAMGIPLDHAVRFLFAMDVRRVLKPPLAEGNYGNGAYLGCARNATAQEVVNGSPWNAVKMIKEAKTSLNDDYLRSSISFLEMKRRSCRPEITYVRVCAEDTYITDWRWLGFNQVDFGWGKPIIAWPGSGFRIQFCPIVFLQRPDQSKSGVMMVFCVPRQGLKALETEMHSVM